LAAAGIQLAKPVELTSDGAGGIDLLGPHPQQAEIERALASDYLLERDFHEVVGESGADAAAFALTVTPDA
jgi:hypothetical protein